MKLATQLSFTILAAIVLSICVENFGLTVTVIGTLSSMIGITISNKILK